MRTFESFLNKLKTLDPILVEAVKTGYSVIFEELRVPETIKSWLSGSKVQIPVYHATGKKFKSFDVSKTSPESYFGSGIYFTDSAEDARKNYSHEKGGDVDNRIYSAVDSLVSGYNEEMIKILREYLKQVRPNWKDNTIERTAQKLADEHPEGFEKKQAVAIAKKALTSAFRTIPAFINLKNPVVVTKEGSTHFDMSAGDGNSEPEYDPENEEQLAEAEKMGLDYDYYHTQMMDEYYDKQNSEEPTGPLWEFATILKQLIQDSDMGGRTAERAISGLNSLIFEQFIDGGNIFDITNAIRNQEYLNDPDINIPNLMRLAFEEMGFDGIIMDPDPKWKMDIPAGTKHYIVFDPANIRSALSGTQL